MAVTATATSTVAILKTLWPQERVENEVYKKHAFLAMIPKDKGFYGENLVLAVRYADSQGRSATFATAQANIGAFAARKFVLTRAKDYQLVSLETEAIQASEKDKGALIKVLDVEMQSGLNNISKSLATALYRGRSGALGTLASDPGTGTTLTLANINDITSFEVGMSLVFCATATSARRAGGARTVSAVNRDLGTIEVSAAMDAAVASGDTIIAEGDDANGSGSGNKVSGLADWLPSSAPAVGGGDSHFGVDRSVDPTRLAGLRIDASGLNPEEALVTALSRLAREGGDPSHFFMNHADFRNVEISLGSKVMYEMMSVGGIGFNGLKVIGPNGPVKVVADQDCPQSIGYALDMGTWKLYSLKECPQILDLDGNELRREASADRWEARIAYFAQLGCVAPGFNARVSMPS